MISQCFKFVLGSRFIAEYRFNRLISQPVTRLRLTTRLIENIPLQSDIKSALTSDRCGVRVLWGPEGCGKSTHALDVCADLMENKKLRGVLYIPVTATDRTPTEWLSAAVSDGFPGTIVEDASSFAKLLSRHENVGPSLPIPVAIVIDQVENIRRTDSMNKLIKSLAEQSVLKKTFVVLVITKDPSYALGLLELNGRTKICAVGGGVGEAAMRYKWTNGQVDRWLQEKVLSGSEDLRAAGCEAGTPGFLLDNAEEKNTRLIQEAAKYCKQQWELGLKMMKRYGGI